MIRTGNTLVYLVLHTNITFKLFELKNTLCCIKPKIPLNSYDIFVLEIQNTGNVGIVSSCLIIIIKNSFRSFWYIQRGSIINILKYEY